MEITVGTMTFTALSSGPSDGPPVLLLHGFPEGARCWAEVMVLLAAAGLRCVAPDQRGYSPAARPTGVEAYALDLLVADAVGMLDALAWRNVHLVGHDWGAVVAWVLAARHPERVHSLTAVAVPHPTAYAEALRSDPDQQRRSAYMRLFREPAPRPESVLLANGGARLASMYEGSGLRPEEVAAFVEPLLGPGVLTGALNWYRAMAREDFAEVGPVSMPTTYVWGALDVAVGRVAATGTAAQVSGEYRFVELEQTSHWVPEQVPDLLAGLIVERVRG